MIDAWKNAVPAIIALIGTILVALVGYRQWKRQQEATRTSDFRLERQKAYKELWEKLEGIHIRLRRFDVEKEQFRSLVRDMNEYILQHGLYLEKDDRRLANDYLAKVQELTSLVATCSSTDAKRAMEDTAELSPEVTDSVQQLGNMQKEVDSIRESIITRYRKALMGDIVQSRS